MTGMKITDLVSVYLIFASCATEFPEFVFRFFEHGQVLFPNGPEKLPGCQFSPGTDQKALREGQNANLPCDGVFAMNTRHFPGRK